MQYVEMIGVCVCACACSSVTWWDGRVTELISALDNDGVIVVI